jgi:hypothetical protein
MSTLQAVKKEAPRMSIVHLSTVLVVKMDPPCTSTHGYTLNVTLPMVERDTYLGYLRDDSPWPR